MRKQLNLIQFSRVLVPFFVVLFHAKVFMNVYFHYDFLKLSEVIKSGGVYYFFALSGFMVYYLYKGDFGNPKKIKIFFYKRFIRIYPIYWILTLCILPFFFIFPGLGDGSEREFMKIVTSLLLFPDVTEPILGVAWSLVHTVFFYIMFSLTFLENKKISKWILSLWGILSFIFGINLLTSTNYFISFLFSFNNLIFLSGIVCAYVVSNVKINENLSWLFIFVGILGFPLSWLNIQYRFIDIGLQIPITLSSIILLLGLGSIDLQKDIKIPRFAQFLGNASFSIYLVHYYCMSAISIFLSSVVIIPIPNLLLAIILIILSIIFGCLAYILIEKPVNTKLKNLYFSKQNNQRSLVFKNYQ